MTDDYRLQLSSTCFEFDVITASRSFKTYSNIATKYGLFKDVCDETLDDVEAVPIPQYLNIKQKSKTWFRFRAAADGTASSVGKKIKCPNVLYPTMEEVSQHWHDDLSHKPFEKTHAMTGHMKWGVLHEDAALIHFAVDNMVTVTAVGTIHLPFSYVLGLAKNKGLGLGLGFDSDSDSDFLNAHLLVSPDGIVEATNGETLGMLEIKCISPFHHLEVDDSLKWVDDMEKRQWYSPKQIPFVYITQICLQALSGIHRLDMNENHHMWFIRWSPLGFSEFKISFGPLVKMGIIATLLYYRLKHRLSLETLPIEYNAEEQKLANLLAGAYTDVMEKMTHRYIDHGHLYPEFALYKRITQFHQFVVTDS